MNTKDLDYNLPEEKIAKYPPEIRGRSKLLVINRDTNKISHHKYGELEDFLNEGDVLILNNTKVIRARLHATNSRNKKELEVFLLEKHGSDEPTDEKSHLYSVLYKGKLKVGDILSIHHQSYSNSKINEAGIDKDHAASTKLPVADVEVLNLGGGIAELKSTTDLYELAQKSGEVPIPPYLKRKSEEIDKKRYQTVFAKIPGSVAAPTASLNFTPELQAKLEKKGVKIAFLTLHVGLGTFLPIRSSKLEEHKMHEEYYVIPAATIAEIAKAKSMGKKVVALGTTVTRALEHAAPKMQKLIEVSLEGNSPIDNSPADYNSLSAEADIFIYPGYKFQIVDSLLTNFHAPGSTVLMLAAAFAGQENLQKAYTEALKKDYKFLSYGDSMLII